MDPIVLLLIVIAIVVIVSYPMYVRPRFTAPMATDIVTVLVVVLLLLLLLGRWRYP
jgi:protein-S-isoprenylcysteine O-methyltransferase Ste14